MAAAVPSPREDLLPKNVTVLCAKRTESPALEPEILVGGAEKPDPDRHDNTTSWNNTQLRPLASLYPVPTKTNSKRRCNKRLISEARQIMVEYEIGTIEDAIEETLQQRREHNARLMAAEQTDALRAGGHCLALSKTEAVHSTALVVRQVLTDADIKALHGLYTSIKEADAEMEPSNELFQHPNLIGCRSTTRVTAFFHAEYLIDKALPHIMQKVIRTIETNDKWGLLKKSHNVRVCEYHEYRRGGEVCDPHHCDPGSLVTMSILLSDPKDFCGGEFTTFEANGQELHYDLKQGDGIVFVSEKWHSVQVVEAGMRCSLVTEIWAGPRCIRERDY